MHSLINIIPRKHSNGKLYCQARFFDKSGRQIKSVSFSKIDSRNEAYLCARQKLVQILAPGMPKEEIEQYGILSIEETQSILALPDDNPNEARNTLIVLLGITCGLGVPEIRNLKRDRITPNDMFLIETSNGSRTVPFIGNVKKRLEKLNSFFPESQYVIPNLKNMNKPCDPISISRGLSSVLLKIKIGKERNIVPSVLWETFITLLVSCYLKEPVEHLNMKTLDYLCGFSIFDTELSIAKNSSIAAIKRLMSNLENLNWIILGAMNWLTD
jgi:integrase